MNANTHLYVHTGGGAGLYMYTNTDTELTEVVSSVHIVNEAQRKGIAFENIVFDSDVALSVQMDVEYLMAPTAITFNQEKTPMKARNTSYRALRLAKAVHKGKHYFDGDYYAPMYTLVRVRLERIACDHFFNSDHYTHVGVIKEIRYAYKMRKQRNNR